MRVRERVPERRPSLEEVELFLRAAVSGSDLPGRPFPAGAATAARRHGLSGALASVADHGGGESAMLRQDWLRSRRWTKILDLECARIADGSQRAGLRPAVLAKGASVASRYRDPSIRGYEDIDLLVARGELGAWSDLLERLGYAGPSGWLKEQTLRFHHRLLFVRNIEPRRIVVELHWRFFEERVAGRVDDSVLSPYREPGPIDGLERLAPAAQAVVLAIHLAHHTPAERKLIWLRDLVEICDAGVTADARALAREHGVTAMLETALALAEDAAGERRWAAVRRSPRGLARARATYGDGLRWHIARAIDLGPREGFAYVRSRFDPDRFRDKSGKVEWNRALAWARGHLSAHRND